MLSRNCSTEILEKRHLLTATLVSTFPSSPLTEIEVRSFDTIGDEAFIGLGLSEPLFTQFIRTDGTPNGTSTVDKFVPNHTSVVGDKLVFSGIHERPSPQTVEQATYVIEGNEPTQLGNWGRGLTDWQDEAVYFDNRENSIVITDGSLEGTRAVPDSGIDTDSSFSDFRIVGATSDRIYVWEDFGENQLWSSDGQEGIRLERRFPESDRLEFHQFGNRLWGVAQQSDAFQLWARDSDNGRLSLMLSTSQAIYLDDAALIDDELFFQVGSNELWKSDGTAAGTSSVQQDENGLRPSPSIVSMLGVDQDLLYIEQGTDGDFDLWIQSTDEVGTGQRTHVYEFSRLVTDLEIALVTANDVVYFTDGGNVPGDSSTLYRYTIPSGELSAGPTFDGGIVEVRPFQDGTLLVGDDGSGPALWQTNPDFSTEKLHAFENKSTSVNWSLVGVTDDQLLLQTTQNRGGGATEILWAQDANGTLTALTEVSGVQQDAIDGVWAERGVDLLYHLTTDGTRDGTRYLYTTTPHYNESGDISSALRGDVLYFAQETDTQGVELWARDIESTWLVKDILPGSFGSTPSEFSVVDDIVYFQAADETALIPAGRDRVREVASNFELWRSDGTEEGTYKLVDANPGVEAPPLTTSSSRPSSITPVEAGFVFITQDLFNQYALWKSDGTVEGTAELLELPGPAINIQRAGETFVLSTLSSGNQLWVTDGTVGGTVPVEELPPRDEHVRDNLAFDGDLYFVGAEIDPGAQLWVSNGSEAGTQRYDFEPGDRAWVSLSTPVTFNNEPHFVLTSPTGPNELWKVGDTQLEGDFNLDGRVDFEDFLVLSDNFGKSDIEASSGDITGDLKVDFDDFLQFSANFGEETTKVEPVPASFPNLDAVLAALAQE